MTDSCTYTVNSDDRMLRVGGRQNSFAVANDAPELSDPAPLGQSLFAFIADPTTAELYRQILAQVRSRQASQEYDLRCDGPRVRRFLRLTFSPAALGQTDITSRVVREEPRDSVPLLDRARPRSDELLRSCSWCERVQAHGSWCEVEEAVARLQLFDDVTLPAVSHGICEDCLERVERDLANS